LSVSSTSWNLFPLTTVFKKIRYCEIRRIVWCGLSLQHRVWPQMPSLKGHCRATGTNCRLCSKVWYHPRIELQQSSENGNVESTVDPLPFRCMFFMNHTLFVKKKCDEHGLELELLDFEVHCMPWSFVSGSYRCSHDSVPVTMHSRNKLNCLHNSGWSRGMMCFYSVLLMRPSRFKSHMRIKHLWWKGHQIIQFSNYSENRNPATPGSGPLAPPPPPEAFPSTWLFFLPPRILVCGQCATAAKAVHCHFPPYFL
jgi:hypothetical protein